MSFEVIERNGVRYAEVIRADARVEKTRFFSDAGSSFQFGLLANTAGYVEPAHDHHPIVRQIADLQQMFVVQRGIVAVDFFSDAGERFDEVVLQVGDAICLVHGAHSFRVIEDAQCVSVKQGPFMGDEMDKVSINAK